MQIRSLRLISQLANIGFRIQHAKLPLIKVSNPFLHKMPVLVNFLIFFPDYTVCHMSQLQRIATVFKKNRVASCVACV